MNRRRNKIRAAKLTKAHHLCPDCRRVSKFFTRWIKLQAEPVPPDDFFRIRHCRSFADLKRSARAKCHLCGIIWDAFMHPEDLPTRELADLPGDPVFVRFDRYFPDMWVEGGDEVERFTFTEMNNNSELDYFVLSEQMRTSQRIISNICWNGGHPLCAQRAGHPPRLPNRIIEVSIHGGEYLRLVDTREENIPIDRYVALSHRWGVGEDIDDTTRTTEENLDKFSNGMVLSDLCPKYIDAVRITIRLGIRYIWIDSICIVQEDLDDWATESRSMYDIYRNAWVTIAASEAQSSLEYCCGSEPVNSIPCRLTAVTNDKHEGHEDHFYVEPSHRDYNTSMIQSPLYKRAWLLQEWVLSTRIFMYTHNQIIWECGPTVSKFVPGGTLGIDRNYPLLSAKETIQEAFVALDSPNNNDLVRPTPDELYDAWYMLVTEYSSREMSFPRDKLPAIRGLATAVSKCLEISDPSLAVRFDSYQSGLWVGDFARGILWSRQENSPPAPRPGRAPSWSWASHDCTIFWKSTDMLFNQRFETRAVWDNFDSPTFDDVTGDVQGFAIVDAVAKRAHFQWNRSPLLYADGATLDPIYCMMDDEIGFGMDQLWIMKVAASIPQPDQESFAYCIVLDRYHDEDGLGFHYERVGYMHMPLDWFEGVQLRRWIIH